MNEIKEVGLDGGRVLIEEEAPKKFLVITSSIGQKREDDVGDSAG